MPQKRDPQIKECHPVQAKAKPLFGFWPRLRGIMPHRAGCTAALGVKHGGFLSIASVRDSNGDGTGCHACRGQNQWHCQTKGRGGGKHIAQVKFTYQIHCLNQKRDKPLVLCSSKWCVQMNKRFYLH